MSPNTDPYGNRFSPRHGTRTGGIAGAAIPEENWGQGDPGFEEAQEREPALSRLTHNLAHLQDITARLGAISDRIDGPAPSTLGQVETNDSKDPVAPNLALLLSRISDQINRIDFIVDRINAAI